MDFVTQRLRLRPWRQEDTPAFAVMDADPRVREFLPPLASPAASLDFAESIRTTLDARGWGLWALERREDGAFIGFTGLNVPTTLLPFSPCVEIGWRLAYPAWGKGYATEAARAALRFGFETLGLEEVVAFTVPANTRSRGVMERLGMRFDSFFDHPALEKGNPLQRHCLYRLARQAAVTTLPDPLRP